MSEKLKCEDIPKEFNKLPKGEKFLNVYDKTLKIPVILRKFVRYFCPVRVTE